MGKTGDVFFCIERVDVDVFHGGGDHLIEGLAGYFFGLGLPLVETSGGKANGVVIEFCEVQVPVHGCLLMNSGLTKIYTIFRAASSRLLLCV